MPYETIQMKCENSMLTEMSQSQKDRYCVIPFIYKIVKVVESVSGMVVARGWNIGNILYTYSFVQWGGACLHSVLFSQCML